MLWGNIVNQRKNPISIIDDKSKRQDWTFFLVLMLLTIAVYWKFLFGIKAFVFVDVGDDSYYQTIPILMNRARTLFQDGNLARYNILLGLGQFESGLNLTDTLLTLFGEKSVPYMMGVFQALKTVFAGWFFYKFTRERGFDYRACLLAGLGYAFSGAMLTRLAFFSYSNEYLFVALALYALELLYQRGNLWLFPIASALLVQSFDAVRAIFYFLFFAVYTIFRCYADGEPIRFGSVVLRALKVMGLQLLGYAFVAALILPGYRDLVSSNRLSTVSGQAASGMGELINTNAILTSFLRSFSNEIFGNSVNYTGRNTYVCGPAFVIGAMNVLMFPQVFVRTENKKRLWYLLAVGAIGVYIVFAPLRLLMNGFAYDRFKLTSFYITIIMLYFAALVWDRFFKEGVFSRPLFLLTGGGVLAVLLGLTLTDIRPLDPTASWITIAVVSASMVAVLLSSLSKKAWATVLLVGVLFVDLWVNSYTSVDHRLTLSMEDYRASYLHGGIRDLAASLKEDETDYFRITNFDSSYQSLRCDGQANNYLSTSTYDGGSGISNEYNRFTGLVGGNMLNQFGYRTFSNNDFTSMLPVQSLLGVRYVIIPKTSMPFEPIVPYGYTLTEDDANWVLKNEHALPLAIAFDSVISASNLERMPQLERREALLSHAMVEDDSALLSSALTVASAPERDLHALLSKNAIPLTQETESVLLEEDATQVFRVNAALERPVDADYALIYANINATVGANDGEQVFISWAGADGVFTSEHSMWYSMPPGQNELLLELPIRGAQYLRLDVTMLEGTASFTSVTEAADDYFSLYDAATARLNQNAFSFTRLDNHAIEGSITLDQPKLLTFTFLTDTGWSATVNGAPAKLELVDGGFMGVYLNAGQNEVKLSYHVENQGLYTAITAASLGLYALILVLSTLRKKKQAAQT